MADDDGLPEAQPIESVSVPGEQPAEADLIEPVLLPPRGLVAVTIAALLATAAVAVLLAPPVRAAGHASLALDTWRGTDDERAAMRAHDDALLRPQVAAPVQAAQAKVLRLLTAWLQAERVHGADVDETAQARALLGEAEEQARTLALLAGKDALRMVAVQFGRQVRAAVEAAVQSARARDLSLQEFLVLAPAPPESVKLADLAGALGTALAAAGIDAWGRPSAEAGPGGALDPAAALVIEALAAQRVLALGVRLPDGAPELPQDAALLLLRFKVEAHEGLALARKLALLEDLETADPAYPSAYTTAALLGRAQRFRECGAWFQRAATLGQRPQQARVNAQWCGERAAIQAGQATPE